MKGARRPSEQLKLDDFHHHPLLIVKVVGATQTEVEQEVKSSFPQAQLSLDKHAV